MIRRTLRIVSYLCTLHSYSYEINYLIVYDLLEVLPYLPGKVVIDAFRLTDPRTQALGQEPRQTTSNLGHLQKPSIQVS